MSRLLSVARLFSAAQSRAFASSSLRQRRQHEAPRGSVLLSIVAVVAVAGQMAACASAPVRPDEGVAKGDTAYMAERLDYEIEAMMSRTDAPSVVISVVNETGPIFEKAYGLAEVEGERAATLQTPYRVGSNSKIFVLLSILRLVDEGKVDLDAPLKTYLPEFTIGPPPAYLPGAEKWSIDDITIRRMLTHHSGLPNDYMKKFFSDAPLTLDELLEGVATQRAAAPVDLVWSYSNLALALLGIVVERQAGVPLDAYAKTHFFDPWGMKTATFTWDDEVTKNIARGYSAGEKKKLYKLSMWPAGRMMASASDMGKMASALLRKGDGAVNPALLLTSMTRQNENIALDFDWEVGLTWFLNRQDDALGKSAEHGGDTLYHHTTFALLPEQNLGVYVATNDAKATGEIHKITSLALALALEAKTGEPVTEPKPVEPSAEASGADPSHLTAIAGEWSTVMGMINIVQPGAEATVGTFDAIGETFEIAELDSKRFGLWVKLFGLFPLRPSGLDGVEIWPERHHGLDVLVLSQKGIRAVFGVRPPAREANAAWSERLGEYVPSGDTADHFDVITKLVVDKDDTGRMIIRVEAMNSGEMTQGCIVANDTQMVTIGMGRGQSLWLQSVGDDALDFSGLRFVRAKPAGEK